MERGKITKNTTYILLASIIQKIGAFIFFILLARFLGVEAVGKYVFALSFAGIFGTFSDLGLSFILNREIARNKEKGFFYFNIALAFKIIFSLFSYLLVIIFVNILYHDLYIKLLVYLAGIWVILDSFGASLAAVFKGLQRLEYESFIIVVREMLILIFGGIALYLRMPLWVIFILCIFFSALNFIYFLIIIYKKTELRIKLNFDKKIVISLLKISLTFTLAGIFSQIFWNIDKVLLSKISSDEVVGIYSIAYKLIFALQFIPLAFSTAIFPAFSHYFVNNREKLLHTFKKTFNYLMIIAIPLSFGVYFLADKIILKVYGPNYLSSVLPLKILITSLFFFFMSFIFGAFLNACEKHRANMINWIIVLIVNIVINLILIPNYKAEGTSFAFLISIIILFFLSLWSAKEIICYKVYLENTLFKTIFSAILMSFIILYFREKISIFILIPFSALSYFLILYLIKGIKKEDFLGIKESLSLNKG